MSDDIEIDFDEDNIPQEASLSDTEGMPALDGAGEQQTLSVGVIGDNAIGRALPIMFGAGGDNGQIDFTFFDDIDKACESKGVHIFFVCMEPIIDGEHVDDVPIIDAFNKLNKFQSKRTVILKSTVSPDTIGMIAKCFSMDMFVYHPETAYNDDIKEILDSELDLIGGNPEPLERYKRLMYGASCLDRKLFEGTLYDVALLKMCMVSFRAIEQTFWNQVYDFTAPMKANYNVVRKTFAEMKRQSSTGIPTFVRAKGEGMTFKRAKSFSGEYDNRDVRVFANVTDKLPLLDECINKKNLE